MFAVSAEIAIWKTSGFERACHSSNPNRVSKWRRIKAMRFPCETSSVGRMPRVSAFSITATPRSVASRPGSPPSKRGDPGRRKHPAISLSSRTWERRIKSSRPADHRLRSPPRAAPKGEARIFAPARKDSILSAKFLCPRESRRAFPIAERLLRSMPRRGIVPSPRNAGRGEVRRHYSPPPYCPPDAEPSPPRASSVYSFEGFQSSHPVSPESYVA